MAPRCSTAASRVFSSRLHSERAVYKAAEAFSDGALQPKLDAELAFTTAEGKSRLIDGICFDSDAEELVGAKLVGWLVESERASAVGAWWRRGARAVLLKRDGAIAVTAPTDDLEVDGAPAPQGLATQEPRFIAEHLPSRTRPSS